MRSSSRQVNKILKKQITKTFLQAVADINDLKKADKIFADFMSENEMEVFTKRLAIAYWLKKGRSYANIKENLKVSSATIASVQGMMERPGFVELLKLVEAEEFANLWSEKIGKVLPIKR